MVKALEEAGEDFRLLILSDHKTLTATRGHDGDPVPYLLYDSTRELRRIGRYSEKEALEGGIVQKEGYKLMERFFHS